MGRDGIIRDLVAELANTGDVPVSFGKYRLHRLIACGGMGRVYLAGLVGELGFEKRLVVKTILPELGDDPLFVELFAAEAKTAVALSHGNIVPIYELGRCDGVYYIAMGYVDGPSLALLLDEHRRQGRPIGLAIALFIVREILTGMAYAHQAEPGREPVVHRDLSPRNVMLDRSGQVRIVDFGIAMPSRMRVRGGMGSFGYVAPEQARAAPADPRADVFSVACLLYELVTGNRAYPRPDVWAPPDLSDAPPELRGILKAALSTEPLARPSDAGEFLDALAPALTRHAATYGDRDLAAHLQRLFPGGWDHSRPAVDIEAPEHASAAAPQTFATRFTMLTSSGGSRGETPRLRWLATAAAVAGLGLVAVTVDPLGARGDPPAMRAAPLLRDRPTDPSGANASANPQPEVRSRLGPKAHTVELRVDPLDAIVEFGDRRWEGSPVQIEVTDEATAVATIYRAGYEPENVDLAHAGPSVEVTLRPVRAGEGRLSVLTPTLSWAEVHIDGKRQQNTPLTELVLPVGHHRVVVRCVPDVCESPRTVYDRRVRIQSDRTTEIRVDGQP